MAEQPSPHVLRVRASVVCCHDNRILAVRSIDPVSQAHYLFLPGGGVEAGESPQAAAVREAAEETGYAVRLIGEPTVREYPFLWAGKTYNCRTSFFAAELIDPAAAPGPTLYDPILHGAEWIPAAQLDRTFAYHDTILEMARQLSRRRLRP